MSAAIMTDNKMFGTEAKLQRYFNKLRGQRIVKITATKSSAGDQTITIETEKSTLKFGANDLGTWFVNYKEKKEAER